MKTLALITVAALFAIGSLSATARAGSYDDDDYGNDDSYAGDDQSYHKKSYRKHYCHYKRVKWYDDYGYKHYKRVKICS